MRCKNCIHSKLINIETMKEIYWCDLKKEVVRCGYCNKTKKQKKYNETDSFRYIVKE